MVYYFRKGDVIHTKSLAQLFREMPGRLLVSGSFYPDSKKKYPNVMNRLMFDTTLTFTCDVSFDTTIPGYDITTFVDYPFFSWHSWMIDWDRTEHKETDMEIE